MENITIELGKFSLKDKKDIIQRLSKTLKEHVENPVAAIYHEYPVICELNETIETGIHQIPLKYTFSTDENLELGVLYTTSGKSFLKGEVDYTTWGWNYAVAINSFLAHEGHNPFTIKYIKTKDKTFNFKNLLVEDPRHFYTDHRFEGIQLLEFRYSQERFKGGNETVYVYDVLYQNALHLFYKIGREKLEKEKKAVKTFLENLS